MSIECQFKEGQYCFIFTKNGTKLKLKTNIWTRLNHLRRDNIVSFLQKIGLN